MCMSYTIWLKQFKPCKDFFFVLYKDYFTKMFHSVLYTNADFQPSVNSTKVAEEVFHPVTGPILMCILSNQVYALTSLLKSVKPELESKSTSKIFSSSCLCCDLATPCGHKRQLRLLSGGITSI